MFNSLFLKSFSSALTLSFCLLSQSALGMEPENYSPPKSLKKRTYTEKQNLKSDESDIYVPDTPWINLQPYLENLIQLTVADPMCEERTIHFKLLGKDFKEYVEWEDSVWDSFRYPIGIGSGSNGGGGNKIDGKYESYNQYIRITNHAKKEKEVRELSCYKVFEEPGSRIHESKINPDIFYNLMMNAGFRTEDFAEGKYGYQDHIYVKPVNLKNKILGECVLEMKETILSTLKKETKPYVTFILELDGTVPYTLAELKSYGGRDSFFHELEPLAKIVAQEENRIYVVYYNDKKSTLDLHKLDLSKAKEKVTTFIEEKYFNFESECTIITGRGNHINSNGSSGVLNKMVPIWLTEPELKPYIQNINLGNGGGLYKVKLFEPTHITLANVFDVDVATVANFISEENKEGRNRLKITGENQPSEYIDKVIVHAITHPFLYPVGFPTSFNYGPKSKGKLMWGQEELSDEEDRGIVLISNKQPQKQAQPKQTNVQPPKMVQPKQNNGQPQKPVQPKQNNVQHQKAVQPQQYKVQPQKSVQPNQYNAQAPQRAQPKQNNAQKKKKPGWEVKNSEKNS